MPCVLPAAHFDPLSHLFYCGKTGRNKMQKRADTFAITKTRAAGCGARGRVGDGKFTPESALRSQPRPTARQASFVRHWRAGVPECALCSIWFSRGIWWCSLLWRFCFSAPSESLGDRDESGHGAAGNFCAAELRCGLTRCRRRQFDERNSLRGQSPTLIIGRLRHD
jgi:hypothetical protein